MIWQNQKWNQWPQDLVLGISDVHIWHADLDRDSEEMGALSAVLSDDEMARARRFHFEQDKNRFIAARGILRHLLGSYLSVEPSEIKFDYGSKGKPRLGFSWATSELNFNIAHSQQRGIFAISRGKEVGIDIECFRNLSDLETIAKCNFNSNELASMLTLPVAARPAAFFRCWTRKEAFLKAIGEGLSHPLDQIEVSLLPDQPARLLRIKGEAASRWSIWDLPVGCNASSALVVDGGSLKLTCMEWSWGRRRSSTATVDSKGIQTCGVKELEQRHSRRDFGRYDEHKTYRIN